MQSQLNFSRRKAAAILVAMTMCLPAAFAAEKSFDRTLSVNGPVTLRVSPAPATSRCLRDRTIRCTLWAT